MKKQHGNATRFLLMSRIRSESSNILRGRHNKYPISSSNRISLKVRSEIHSKEKEGDLPDCLSTVIARLLINLLRKILY